ncbi:TetR/AcrR family transcriptional regulator [Klebsiella huaxiensis]|uniref:TetR/AcrR family transcriptional regulator n=1 Tax=Klebsiella huaxiensis TaxID=2153354 RepID=A0ABT6EJ46_9ENTR|nr:TetR/AcrR family transcriptional regulator [Klebsiella huaxiensis]MDG1645427.1 TetR/AcrR family transcriptional regulator [Klebsiella huaxiensis]QBG06389.1 TetR/AcrR family transcriptional regulator [Klebsiella huaxiensis]
MKNKRKIQLADFNRMVILATSNTLFLSRGIEGTTMDEIAHDAGFSKTTLYTYFENKQDILDHLILDGMERFHHEVVKIASRKNPFREFYHDFCQALIAIHDSGIVYFPGITGKIGCSDKEMKNNKVLMNIYMLGEEINQIIAAQISRAVEKKEIKLNAPIVEVMMLFWLCLTGLVEKSSSKEDYLLRHLEKDRKYFLEFAFESLLVMIEKGTSK